jgi:isopropylmalate/homocitrate/citramalate synthase
MSEVKHLLASWNPVSGSHLQQVRLEDDIRDALQSVRLQQPSLAQRIRLLELSAEVGVQHAFVGFPAASQQEFARCTALVGHVRDQQLTIEPIVMARAIEADVEAILAIREATQAPMAADIFIGVSDLRLRVENWTFNQALQKLEKACALALRENLPFRVSLEDSSRVRPDALSQGLQAATDCGAVMVVICDTVGDCLPEGARRLTEFALNELTRIHSPLEIGWHGHNDKGLSLANAWAAAESGASMISGTFLGFGERTGNTPLEQLIWLLREAGNRHYDLEPMVRLCAYFAESAGTNISPQAPLVGADAFSTSTGTHVAAILKSRSLGEAFEDLVYSSVPARALGRHQALMLGPGSGRSAVECALQACGVALHPELVDRLWSYCRNSQFCLAGLDAIRDVVRTLYEQKVPNLDGHA